MQRMIISWELRGFESIFFLSYHFILALRESWRCVSTNLWVDFAVFCCCTRAECEHEPSELWVGLRCSVSSLKPGSYIMKKEKKKKKHTGKMMINMQSVCMCVFENGRFLVPVWPQSLIVWHPLTPSVQTLTPLFIIKAWIIHLHWYSGLWIFFLWNEMWENNVNNQWMMEQKPCTIFCMWSLDLKRNIICTLQDKKDNLWTRKHVKLKNAYYPSKWS